MTVAQVRSRLKPGPSAILQRFEQAQRDRQTALESVEERLLSVATRHSNEPVSELLSLHEHLAKAKQQASPPILVSGYYLDDSMPLWPFFYAGLGWLCVLLAPENLSLPKLPTRAVAKRALCFSPFIFVFYSWPTWFRNSALGQVDRKVYAYSNLDIRVAPFVAQEFMALLLCFMIAMVWAQWLSFFEQRARDIRDQSDATTEPGIKLRRVERLQTTFLHWQVSSLVLGVAFLYSTFFFWARVAHDSDLRYVPNAVATHLIWIATWLIVSAPLFITWWDWVQYRVRLLVAVANSKKSEQAEAMQAVLDKLHPVSFWNLTGSTVVGLVSLVLPIAHGLY
jgi:hypothetical protein